MPQRELTGRERSHVEVGQRRPHPRDLLLRGRRPGDRPLQLLLGAGGLGFQDLQEELFGDRWPRSLDVPSSLVQFTPKLLVSFCKEPCGYFWINFLC